MTAPKCTVISPVSGGGSYKAMYSDGANTDKKTEKTAASLQCRVPIESRNRLQRVKECVCVCSIPTTIPEPPFFLFSFTAPAAHVSMACSAVCSVHSLLVSLFVFVCPSAQSDNRLKNYQSK